MEPLTIPLVLQSDERTLIAVLAATLIAPVVAELRVSSSVQPEIVMEKCADIAVAFARILLTKVDESLK